MKKHTSRLISALLVLCMALALLPGTAWAAETPGAKDFKAVLSAQKLAVDGREITCEKYNINGSNYFKLRDLAELLNGTDSQFEIGYDETTQRITVTSGMAYTHVGGELEMRGDLSDEAEVSSQILQINGVTYLSLKVYNIGGNNFFQLRQLSNLLGFFVTYIENTNTAAVFSDLSYATLANGKAITEENVREIIYGLRSDYPEGMHWTNDDSYTSSAVQMYGYGCEAFALICSDAAFWFIPVISRHSDFDAVKVGDLLRINNDTHTVIVLEKKQDSVIVAEGNYNSSIHWGREITRQRLEAGNFTVRSRYPVG